MSPDACAKHDGCATMEVELLVMMGVRCGGLVTAGQIEHKPLGRLMLTLMAKPLHEDSPGPSTPERSFHRCVSTPGAEGIMDESRGSGLRTALIAHIP
eukprot:768032-Hanusia_phi.AAC.2